MTNPQNKQLAPEEEFARAATMKRPSFWSDYYTYLKTTKKWWMVPLILILLAYGFLMVLGSTGAAPFIYTLF